MAGNRVKLWRGVNDMKKIYIMESFKGAKVCCPPNVYKEKIIIGRYTIKAMLFADGGYSFYVFRGKELKAIIGSDDWFISKLDGEGQNLVNRLMKIFG